MAVQGRYDVMGDNRSHEKHRQLLPWVAPWWDTYPPTEPPQPPRCMPMKDARDVSPGAL